MGLNHTTFVTFSYLWTCTIHLVSQIIDITIIYLVVTRIVVVDVMIEELNCLIDVIHQKVNRKQLCTFCVVVLSSKNDKSLFYVFLFVSVFSGMLRLSWFFCGSIFLKTDSYVIAIFSTDKMYVATLTLSMVSVQILNL